MIIFTKCKESLDIVFTFYYNKLNTTDKRQTEGDRI